MSARCVAFAPHPPNSPKLTKLAANDDKAIAEAFAQQTYTAVGNRDREIMRDPYLLGFEIVEKNEDNSRLIGVFAFRVNREILMVTVFYLNGKVKGTDLLYRKGVNLFTYNGEKWISYLLSQDEDEDGRAVARSGGGNRARMNLGLGDMYSNPVSSGYKRAAELPADPTECATDPAEGMGEDSDDCCKECGEGKACTCDPKEKTATAIRGFWADMTAAAPNAEAEPLFRQMLVDGGLGKQAAELVERLPELGDIIVLAKALEQPLKQAGINSPFGDAVAAPEPMDSIPGDQQSFNDAARRLNAPTAQDERDMAELQARLDNPNDQPGPGLKPGPGPKPAAPPAPAPDNWATIQMPTQTPDRAAVVAKFNAQQAAKTAVPFVGPPAPDKQSNALIWHAEPQVGWSEDMVSEFYRKGYLLEDKRAAANKATAFETEGIEQRMATARGAGVMRVLDRGGKSHKVLFGPRSYFDDLSPPEPAYGSGRTNEHYQMLSLDGPHKDTICQCHDQGPGYDPLVEEQNGEAEDLEIPKGEQPKAGKRYQLWLDDTGFVGYGSFEVYSADRFPSGVPGWGRVAPLGWRGGGWQSGVLVHDDRGDVSVGCQRFVLLRMNRRPRLPFGPWPGG